MDSCPYSPRCMLSPGDTGTSSALDCPLALGLRTAGVETIQEELLALPHPLNGKKLCWTRSPITSHWSPLNPLHPTEELLRQVDLCRFIKDGPSDSVSGSKAHLEPEREVGDPDTIQGQLQGHQPPSSGRVCNLSVPPLP